MTCLCARRQLLAFVTGSDRVPINGLGALHPPFVIHKNGDARCPCPANMSLQAAQQGDGDIHLQIATCLTGSKNLGGVPAVTACPQRIPASMPSC